MASFMYVHIPAHNTLHKHFAFVSEEIVLTKEGVMPYDERVIPVEFQKTLNAGVYGFRDKETRDTFISMINKSSDIERAFIAKFGSPPDYSTCS